MRTCFPSSSFTSIRNNQIPVPPGFFIPAELNLRFTSQQKAEDEDLQGERSSRTITTAFTALLLDEYSIKLHYCSNVLIFLINVVSL